SSLLLPPPTSTLFPYTTLFRSRILRLLPGGVPRGGDPRGGALRERGVLARPLRVRSGAAVRSNASRVDAVGPLRPQRRVAHVRGAGPVLGIRRTGAGERARLHHPAQPGGERLVARGDAVCAGRLVRAARRPVH